MQDDTCVEIDAQERAGDVEVRSDRGGAATRASRTSERVANGEIEILADENVAGIGEGDERAAFVDEIAERVKTFFADAAGVFGRKFLRKAEATFFAFYNGFTRRVREDDGVVGIVEISGAHFFVFDAFVLEAVLVEEEAGPAFVDFGDVRFVEAEADGLELRGALGKIGARNKLEVEFFGVGSELGMRGENEFGSFVGLLREEDLAAGGLHGVSQSKDVVLMCGDGEILAVRIGEATDGPLRGFKNA